MMLCLHQHHLLHEDSVEFHGEPLPSRGVPEPKSSGGLEPRGFDLLHPRPAGHVQGGAPPSPALPGSPGSLPPTRVRDRAGSTCVCRCAEWGRGRGRAGRGHQGAWFVDVTGPAGQ